MDAMRAIAENALTFLLYIIDLNTIKARCYPRSLLINHLGMVEYVRYLLLAVASLFSYEPIYVGSADGVIDLAIEVA